MHNVKKFKITLTLIAMLQQLEWMQFEHSTACGYSPIRSLCLTSERQQVSCQNNLLTYSWFVEHSRPATAPNTATHSSTRTARISNHSISII